MGPQLEKYQLGTGPQVDGERLDMQAAIARGGDVTASLDGAGINGGGSRCSVRCWIAGKVTRAARMTMRKASRKRDRLRMPISLRRDFKRNFAEL